MDSIRVNSGVKVIEVNDKGETISLPLSDDSFVKGFFDLLNEIKDKATAISEKKGDVLDTLDDIVAFDKDVRDKIDALIGENTCAKVFGAEGAKKLLVHAESIKAAGAKYCDCPACAACEKILAHKDELIG